MCMYVCVCVRARTCARGCMCYCYIYVSLYMRALVCVGVQIVRARVYMLVQPTDLKTYFKISGFSLSTPAINFLRQWFE